MNTHSTFDRLILQIDTFIKKYYVNQMIKGLLLFTGVLLFSYLFATITEFIGRFNSIIRALLFYGFIVINVFILVRYFIYPLSKLFSFGKRINYLQASVIIGSFFPLISDRLKNTLQLNDALSQQQGNIDLLSASVYQRSTELSVIPFSSAININLNKKYLKYILPLFLILLSILVFAPGIFTQGTTRVVNYDKQFKLIAPFSWNLENTNTTIEEGQDVDITLVLRGNTLPESVYLICENGKFLLEKKGKNRFIGKIKKPKTNSSFHFIANEYESDPYSIKLIGKSIFGKLEAKLIYPNYLSRKDELIKNAGDFSVPEGTLVEWSVLTKNTKKVLIKFNNQSQEFFTKGFVFKRKLFNSTDLKVLLFNSFRTKVDSNFWHISVIKDSYPTINVVERKDSIQDGLRYFNGEVGDDYGLKVLNFSYDIISENGNKSHHTMQVNPVSGTRNNFNFAVDFRREKLKLNDKIEYYFTVGDNDGNVGGKFTKSQEFTYQLPNLEQLINERADEQEKSKEDLEKLMQKTQEFKKNVDKLKKELINSKSNDWNKLNQVNQLQEDQKKLLESLEQIKNELNQSTEEKNQLSEIDKEILEKQDLIEKLLEELMDDELKKLLEDLEKLLQENNKEEIKDKIEKIENSSEDLQKQLDRSLEMLKKLQVNEKIDDIEKELKELAKEQEELKKEISTEKIDKEKAIQKQEDINKKFEDLKKELSNLEKLNKELSQPLDLKETETSKEQISKDLLDSKENLQQGKEKKSSEKQQSAADEMKKMADQLDQQQNESNQSQQEEDMDMLRNILESLMTLSFDQESLMSRFTKLNSIDPSYKYLGRLQRKIYDDTQIVKDSLLALAKRQAKIASFIDKELGDIESNHELAINAIDDHRKKDLGVNQQSLMTSYNNLALLLNEALQQMQSQAQKEGNGSCSKPGKGKSKPGSAMNPGDMKQMLKKQLESLQKGPNPGGNKEGQQPGAKPGEGGQNMLGLGNKEIAKMAAEQTAIRQKLEQLRNELNKDGKGNGNKLSPLIKDLEEQEKALINKRFGSEMINRQKDILTRLLESEKALLERGFEEKRESKSGKDQNSSNKIRFDEYNNEKLKQIDLLKAVDPSFSKYYKDKANQYFNMGQ